MFGYRLLIVGIFLTPAMQLTVVRGVGVSVGDVFLIAGSMLMLVEGRVHDRPAPYRHTSWPFLGAGGLITLGVLLSGLARQTAPLYEVASLVLQYGMVFVLLVLALRGLPQDRLETLAVALLAGVTTTVVVGMGLIVARPDLVADLDATGYMVVLGSDSRHGLFTGVGELSKLAPLCLPLAYYLAVRQRIRWKRGLLFAGALLMAVVVTRSASGVATTLVVVAALLVLHLLQRRHIQGVETVSLSGILWAVVAAGGLTAAVVSRLDVQGARLGEGFVTRLVRPFLAGGAEEVGSAAVRLELTREAWQIIGEFPVLGAGPGLYHDLSKFGQGVHVVPLMLWAETGLLPLLGWLVLVLGFMAVVAARWRTAPVAGATAWAMLAGVLLWHAAAPYMYQRIMVVPLLLVYFLVCAIASNPTPASMRGPAKEAVSYPVKRFRPGSRRTPQRSSAPKTGSASLRPSRRTATREAGSCGGRPSPSSAAENL